MVLRVKVLARGGIYRGGLATTSRSLRALHNSIQVCTSLLFEKLYLKEIHNLYKENKVKYTYKQRNRLTLTDRVYTDKQTQRKIITYKIKQTFFSDHQALTINLRWKNREKWGKGKMRNNNEI